MRLLLAILLFPLLSLATTTVIPGANTVRVIDNRLIGTANATTDTFLNKGGGVDALVGFAAGGLEYGRYHLCANIDTIGTYADGIRIDTVVVRLFQNTTSSTNPEITCARASADVKEGTADGVYQAYSESWRQKGGNGTMFNGVVRSGGPADTTGSGPSVWSAGNPVVTGCPTTTVTTAANGYFYWRPTAQVQDSFNVGVNYIGFLFYDQSYDGAQERCRFATTEAVVDSQRPQVTVYYHLNTPEDSTFLRIAITPPSSPLANYPIKVSFLAYPSIASTNITFYASDSTTKLYWWPDSISGHYTRAWVMHDWSSIPDTIFVTKRSNPAYMIADSVFLIYDSFNGASSVSHPITDFINWTGTSFDTNGIMLSPNGAGADSVIREPSGLIKDWQESDASKRWKWFYCGEKLSIAAPNSYNDNFLLWAYSDQYTGTWTKADTVMYDSVGVTQAVNAEDPDLVWLPAISKWAMYLEDHDNSPVYHISVLLADSLDQLEWQKRFLPVLDAQAIGTPTNWLNKEQASPTMTWNATRDTLLMFYEAFTNVGAGPSRLGLALSFSNGAGDTLGLDWYLTDSTGALNPTNPMPIVPWAIPAQADSDKVIPDGAYYLNGKYAVFTHCTFRGSSLPVWYYGDSPRNLVYQGVDDSTHLNEVVVYDTTSGNFLSVYQEDLSKSYIRAQLRDFDSTRWDDPKWTIHFRSDKNTSPNRFRCGEVYQSNGVLCIYPPQRQTGAVAIQSTNSFAPGFFVDAWIQLTSWSTVSNYFVMSVGDTVLQDVSGVQTNEGANWSNTRTNNSYSLSLQTNSVRFRQNNNAIADSSVGSTTGSIGADTLNAMFHLQMCYTTEDSLIAWVDGVKKCEAKDATLPIHTPMYLTLAQGEVAESDAGAVMRMASIHVRKFTTADGTAVASDTLYALTSGREDVLGWQGSWRNASNSSWRNLWR